jgi:hypothetical protein
MYNKGDNINNLFNMLNLSYHLLKINVIVGKIRVLLKLGLNSK